MNDLRPIPIQIHHNSPETHSAIRAGIRLTSTAVLFLGILAFGAVGCKHTATPADDASLTQAVQAKIAAESSLASEPIQASVQQGVVTLSGNTSSDAARSLAANDAAQVVGIRTVVNNLTVTPPPVQPTQSAAIVPPTPTVRPERSVRSQPTVRAHKEPKSRPAPASRRLPEQPPVDAYQAQATPPAPIERTDPSPTPTPPTVPEIRSITLPTDTTIPVRMSQTLDSATTQEGDTFSAVLASDIVVDGRVVLRQGTAVSGRVDAVQEAAHFKGSSLLTIQLTSIQARNNRLSISTDTYSKAGQGRGKNSAEKIGGGAAVGAILGGIFGGGKGAAIGAAAGGGVGAGAQAITKGQQVQIPAESLVRFKLTSPVPVRVSSTHDNQDNPGDSSLQRHNQ